MLMEFIKIWFHTIRHCWSIKVHGRAKYKPVSWRFYFICSFFRGCGCILRLDFRCYSWMIVTVGFFIIMDAKCCVTYQVRLIARNKGWSASPNQFPPCLINMLLWNGCRKWFCYACDRNYRSSRFSYFNQNILVPIILFDFVSSLV
jgi:hypothetical protein